MKKFFTALVVTAILSLVGCNTASMPSYEPGVVASSAESGPETSGLSSVPNHEPQTALAPFESYFEEFVRFFHSPAANPAALPLDSNFAYFLLYESYHTGILAGTIYAEENQFYLIPEEELAHTAETRLGIDDLDLSSIEEWPFWGMPPEGMQLFTEATSLPYICIVEKSIHHEEDKFFAEAILETFLGNEGEITPTVSLSYEFQRVILDDGAEYYQLVSITDNAPPNAS